MTKTEIRKEIKEILKKAEKSLPEKSKKICSKILESDEYATSKNILAYMALWDEVNLEDLITQSLKDGKKVYVPRVIPNSKNIDFYEFSDISFLKPGAFGILEPEISQKKLDPENLTEQTLVLVPGRAFTKKGCRLGRGKGFYDFYLARLEGKKVSKAGVGFSLQVLESLPQEEHDIKLDRLFTDC